MLAVFLMSIAFTSCTDLVNNDDETILEIQNVDPSDDGKVEDEDPDDDGEG